MVYNNPEEKKLIFKSYEKATERIIRMMSRGVPVREIIGARKKRLCAI